MRLNLKIQADQNLPTGGLLRESSKVIRSGIMNDNTNTGVERVEVETASPTKLNSNQAYNQEPFKLMGLYNFSNACYQLAVIQCLDTVQALVDHLRAQRSRMVLDTRLTELGGERGLQAGHHHKKKDIKRIFKASKALMWV